MDRQLRKELKECLRELEASGDIEACLRRHPARAEELRPYLEMAATLDPEASAEPSQADRLEGRRRLLSQIAELNLQKRGVGEMMIFGRRLWPVAAAALAAVFLLGGLAGASAVPGSPVPGPQDALPFFQGDDADDACGAAEEDLEAANEAAEEELEAANEAEEELEAANEAEEELEAANEAAEEAAEAVCEAAEAAAEAEEEAAEAAAEAEEEATEAAAAEVEEEEED